MRNPISRPQMMNSSTQYNSATQPCCFIFDVMGWRFKIQIIMAKIYSNIELSLDQQGEIWSASNGATRRTLIVINKINEQPGNYFRAKLGTLDKGNHSFIFINEEKGNDDDRILGIFLNSTYAYQVLEGKELYTNYSSGGYGNSCSQFGIYEVGTLLEVNTYKNRNTPSYYRLTEIGWIDVPVHEVNPFEIEEV